MTNFYGGADFKILHYNFINGDTSGKIFMLKGYESESASWGKGALIHLYKADPFLLNIILEWSSNNPNGFIGDKKSLFYLTNKNETCETSKKIKKSHYNFNKRKKRMLSLHNILREHKSSMKYNSSKIKVI